MNLALGKSAETQQGDGLKAQFDLFARSFDVGLALALPDEGSLWCCFLGHG
jgi:hypothetical protein